MSIIKAIFAFGVMTLAIVLVPIQVAKLLIKRNQYHSVPSEYMVVVTPVEENSCPNMIYTIVERNDSSRSVTKH